MHLGPDYLVAVQKAVVAEEEQGVVGFQIRSAVGDVRHERLVKKLEESTKNASCLWCSGKMAKRRRDRDRKTSTWRQC